MLVVSIWFLVHPLLPLQFSLDLFHLIYTASFDHGPLARYVKLRIEHAPGMPGTFSAPTRVGDADMHHVTHVTWRMPESLTNSFFWSRWRGKRYRHSRRMRNRRHTDKFCALSGSLSHQQKKGITCVFDRQRSARCAMYISDRRMPHWRPHGTLA